jgi:hypothetical protein
MNLITIHSMDLDLNNQMGGAWCTNVHSVAYPNNPKHLCTNLIKNSSVYDSAFLDLGWKI